MSGGMGKKGRISYLIDAIPGGIVDYPQGSSWLVGRDGPQLCFEDDAVNFFLPRRKLSRNRNRSRQVSRVFGVFGADVHDDEIVRDSPAPNCICAVA
jgi:hypothetical protein